MKLSVFLKISITVEGIRIKLHKKIPTYNFIHIHEQTNFYAGKYGVLAVLQCFNSRSKRSPRFPSWRTYRLDTYVFEGHLVYRN